MWEFIFFWTIVKWEVKNVKKFIYKAANVLCAFAVLIAPIAGRACRILFYEPEKPEGLDDFISKHKGL